MIMGQCLETSSGQKWIKFIMIKHIMAALPLRAF